MTKNIEKTVNELCNLYNCERNRSNPLNISVDKYCGKVYVVDLKYLDMNAWYFTMISGLTVSLTFLRSDDVRRNMISSVTCECGAEQSIEYFGMFKRCLFENIQ